MAFGTFTKDMQLTRSEFEKRLSKDVAGFHWRMTADGAVGENGSQKVLLSLTEQEPRTIAMLTLPRCQLDFAFEGFSAAEKTDFIQKFDQVFQKGGG